MLCVLAALPLSPAMANRPLTLGVHPYLPSDELKQRFTPLIQYLSLKLNAPIVLKISKNYETHLENAGNNHYDIAYLGPSSYVELVTKYGAYPLLARLAVDNKPFFHGYIITRQDSSIERLEQLKGKRFAFGSPHSTMSYLVPRRMLIDAGVRLEDLADHKFLGNHRNVALGVLLGEFDAGAVKEEVYLKMKARGLRQITATPLISEHLFVAKQGMEEARVEQIRNIFLNLKSDPSADVIFGSIKQGLTGFVPVSDADYDTLRKIMY